MGILVTGTAATYVEELTVCTKQRYEIICLTSEVERIVRESGIVDGLVLVNPMHITASIYVNDLEYGLHQDLMDWLERTAPSGGPDGPDGAEYLHHRTVEDNGDAHLKRQIMGREVVVAITEGRLDFGPWEQIFYGEFDGGRRKRVLVKLIGE